MTRYVCVKSFNVPTLVNGDLRVDEGDQIDILWSCMDSIQFMNMSKGVTLYTDNASHILETKLMRVNEKKED